MVDAAGSVEEFLPSRNGFAFTNDFPSGPLLTVPGLRRIGIGDASRGLCGGMIYAARDLFEAGEPPPGSVPPAAGSPLFGYIIRRLFDSFDIPRGVLRYYRLQAAGPSTVSRATVLEEWPRVRLDLDQGVLSPLGIITVHTANPFQLGHNHQVLAYAYTLVGSVVTLRVYDPNTPRARADDVRIVLDLADPSTITHTIAIGDRPVRGFFRSRYRWKDPARALAS